MLNRPGQPERLVPAADAPPDDLPLWLTYADLLLSMRDRDGARAVLAGLSALTERMTARAILRLWGLAARLGAEEAVIVCLRALLDRPVLSGAEAADALSRLHAVAPTGTRDRIAARLAAQVPVAQRRVFDMRASEVQAGPDAALRVFRAATAPTRAAGDAVRLGQRLLATGRDRIALRYLRRCRRVWPTHPRLRSLLAEAASRLGMFETSLDLLDAGSTAAERSDTVRERLTVLLRAERVEEALRLLEAAIADGPQDPRVVGVFLETAVFHLPARRARDVQRTLSSIAEAPLQHTVKFRGSFLGRVLAEKEVFEIECAHGTRAETIAHRNFFAARAIIDSAFPFGTPPPPERGDAVPPRRIVQYWDQGSPPPDIAALIETWKADSAFDHVLHDRQSAMRFLEEACAPEMLVAFRRLRTPTMRSDFLRLAELALNGGIYADADDRLLVSPERLVAPGRGLRLFRASVGCIPNNQIAVVPGHPVIVRALDLALAAIFDGDVDMPWGLVGPGLLTRALAREVLEAGGLEAADVSLRPDYQIRQTTQPSVPLPYRSTAANWRRADTAASRRLLRKLDALA